MKASLSIPSVVGGSDPEESLVAIEHVPGTTSDTVRLFSRRDGDTTPWRDEPFEPFLWVEDESLAGVIKDAHTIEPLEGRSALHVRVRFSTWKALEHALRTLRQHTGRTPMDPQSPFFFISDPAQQYLMATGKTLFKGMAPTQLRVLAVDIETATAEGYEFSNPERAEDRILAIGLMAWNGQPEILRLKGSDEAGLLRRLVERVTQLDPDVIVGHNIFGFDLPFLRERARRHRVELALGREGREPEWRPGRFTAGEYTQNYTRADLWGRAVADTYFLAQLFDLTHRALPGYGLKDVARHLGLAPAGRTYLDPNDIQRVFKEDPERFDRYLMDDLRETSALAIRWLPIYIAQAQVLPMTLQNAMARGNAAKIDGLLLREALRSQAAVPRPAPARAFEGGYTDQFFTGVARPVHHCDVRSLYPSIMLAEHIAPASDAGGVFLRLLEGLRDFRLAAKDAMRRATGSDRDRWDALQGTFKILINSFYGYLGFAQARYSDFDAAERVTARGREILRGMIAAIREQGGDPVEVDTDGVYFVPPTNAAEEGASRDAFRAKIAACLPTGIDVEFDGEYPAMFSYRMKNYALLEEDGEITIKGAALKSRGLEPFLRDFIREWLGLLLHGKSGDIPALIQSYKEDIRERRWPIHRLARQERLTESPQSYQSKMAEASKSGGRARARNAAYELAIASGRTYRAGDLMAYYVTGERKSVPIHAHARLVSEWNPQKRDENVEFYIAKLEDLVERLGASGEESKSPGSAGQGELALD